MGLKDDIAAIKAKAEANNEEALRAAAAAAAKRDEEQKAAIVAAIDTILSDESVKEIISVHAAKGGNSIATIGIKSKEVWLMRLVSPGTLGKGEKLKLRFDANAISAALFLDEHHAQARVAELETQGVSVKHQFDHKSDILVISFDYTNA